MPTGRGVFVGGNPDGAYPLRGKLPFLLWESGMFLLCVGFCLPSWGHSPAVGGFAALRMGRTPCGKTAFSFVGKRDVFTLRWFLPTRLGAKTTFSFDSKEKAVLDSEKEKVDQWKS